MSIESLFAIEGKVAVMTGGAGVLGRAMAQGLLQAGARLVIISLHADSAERAAQELQAAGGEILAMACDVTNRDALEQVLQVTRHMYGEIDILINAAGGNQPQATTTPDRSFFELDQQALEQVFQLNMTGTLLSCQVFGREMAERGQGCIVNVASMSALRPLTRIAGYSAAKAAVVNFTQWLAVHMAQEYSPQIRVNALAPGFFLTEQNRFLLTDSESGNLTARGQSILAHTPAGRFGDPQDLVGALLWLVSPSASFVTGTVIPIDGGFAAFSGV